MARFSVLAIAASITTFLLPATLARPFERPGWGVAEHHGPRPWWSPTATTHHTYTLTENPTSAITATISSASQPNTTCLTTWPSIPNPNCLPINPHCVLPYPTSWFCFGGAATGGTGTGIATGTGTGVLSSSMPLSSEALPASLSSQVQAGTTTDSVPVPTSSVTAPSSSIPTSISTFPWMTGIPPTGIIPTGTATRTATGTAIALQPPLPTLQAREFQALAMHKRKLFEGPRRRNFPHFWPAYNLHLTSTPTAQLAPTQATGTGVMGTGAVGTTIITASTHAFSIPGWSWTFPTGTGTGVLTLPIESGIGGPVAVPTGV